MYKDNSSVGKNILKLIGALLLYVVVSTYFILVCYILYYKTVFLMSNIVVNPFLINSFIFFISWLILRSIANKCVNFTNLEYIRLFRLGTVIYGVILCYIVIYIEMKIMYEYVESALNIKQVLTDRYYQMNMPYYAIFIIRKSSLMFTTQLSFAFNYIKLFMLICALCIPKGLYSLSDYSLHRKYNHYRRECYVSRNKVKNDINTIRSECTKIDYSDRFEYLITNEYHVYHIVIVEESYYIIRKNYTSIFLRNQLDPSKYVTLKKL